MRKTRRFRPIITHETRALAHDDNLTTERPTFVTHLECAATGERYPADAVHNLSRAGKPLLVRYDLAGVGRALSKDALRARPADLWRYRELLPVRKVEHIVSLGEAMTPILALTKLAAKLGAGELLVKDEGRLPTGSFKARGLVMAVSMAKALGIAHMAMPTNGNAGAALAAYASRAGIRTTVFCPQDTPEVNVSEIALQASGCAPMVRAFEAGAEHAPRWENAHTIASGIRVPQAIGDFLILRAVRESGGFAIAVEDAAITAALEEAALEEGFLLCPEGAATYAAYKAALADGRIRRDERALLFNCATGLKYPLPPVHRTLDRTKPIDYAKL